MKKIYFILILFIVIILLPSCQKKDIFHTKNSLISTLPDELQDLYSQLPERDYGNITVIGDGILRFESEDHIEDVMDMLREDCDTWDDLFIDTFGGLNDRVLEELENNLGYDEFMPLREFEAQLNILGLTLRDQQELLMETWLENDMNGNCPIDKIFIDEIEQTLYNQHREICIDTIIYQYRIDGYVMIPIDSIESISIYRTMPLEDLEPLFTIVRSLNTQTDSSKYLPYTWEGTLDLSETSFSKWIITGICNILRNDNHIPKMKSKLINFRFNENTQKWVKTRRLCSITTDVVFYWEGYANTGIMVNHGFTQNYSNIVSEKRRRTRTDIVKGSVSDLYEWYLFGVKDYPQAIITINSVNHNTPLVD